MRKRNERTSNRGNTASSATSIASARKGETVEASWKANTSANTMARPFRIADGLPW
ncbi:hypothetical protein D9M72_326800 [compost metagenome]